MLVSTFVLLESIAAVRCSMEAMSMVESSNCDSTPQPTGSFCGHPVGEKRRELGDGTPLFDHCVRDFEPGWVQANQWLPSGKWRPVDRRAVDTNSV
jgi:hypothetical protein